MKQQSTSGISLTSALKSHNIFETTKTIYTGGIQERILNSMPLLVILMTLCLALSGPPKDKDTDRNGLPDLQEIHKYFTDPAKADSDGDNENWRKETTYLKEFIKPA